MIQKYSNYSVQNDIIKLNRHISRIAVRFMIARKFDYFWLFKNQINRSLQKFRI